MEFPCGFFLLKVENFFWAWQKRIIFAIGI